MEYQASCSGLGDVHKASFFDLNQKVSKKSKTLHIIRIYTE